MLLLRAGALGNPLPRSFAVLDPDLLLADHSRQSPFSAALGHGIGQPLPALGRRIGCRLGALASVIGGASGREAGSGSLCGVPPVPGPKTRPPRHSEPGSSGLPVAMLAFLPGPWGFAVGIAARDGELAPRRPQASQDLPDRARDGYRGTAVDDGPGRPLLRDPVRVRPRSPQAAAAPVLFRRNRRRPSQSGHRPPRRSIASRRSALPAARGGAAGRGFRSPPRRSPARRRGGLPETAEPFRARLSAALQSTQSLLGPAVGWPQSRQFIDYSRPAPRSSTWPSARAALRSPPDSGAGFLGERSGCGETGKFQACPPEDRAHAVRGAPVGGIPPPQNGSRLTFCVAPRPTRSRAPGWAGPPIAWPSAMSPRDRGVLRAGASGGDTRPSHDSPALDRYDPPRPLEPDAHHLAVPGDLRAASAAGQCQPPRDGGASRLRQRGEPVVEGAEEPPSAISSSTRETCNEDAWQPLSRRNPRSPTGMRDRAHRARQSRSRTSRSPRRASATRAIIRTTSRA